jgi:signal transduction histidine kinase
VDGTSASNEASAVEALRRDIERLRERVERLYRVTSTLSTAVTVGEVAGIMLSCVTEACGAEVASLSLVADHAGVSVLATDHFVGLDSERVAPFRRAPLDAPIAAAQAVRGRAPVFIESSAQQEALFSNVASPTAYSGGARVALPLVYRGQVLGSLNLGFREWRTFDDEERTFMLALAAQCALSVTRARMHEANETARKRAEDAVRAREDVLAVVSHDLRNPLGALLAAAATLIRRDGASWETSRGNVERIHRSAMQMARLIDDLADVGSIEAGRLKIEPRACLPPDVVTAVAEMFASTAADRQIAVAPAASPELPPIRADRDRLLQVLSNLVGNALQVAPPGSAVKVGARPTGDDVLFFVQDAGPGVDAGELPYLFERYWRGANTKYRGSGLGLAIAKGIVDAHGGRIWAANEPGGGTTVSFTIPVARQPSEG